MDLKALCHEDSRTGLLAAKTRSPEWQIVLAASEPWKMVENGGNSANVEIFCSVCECFQWNLLIRVCEDSSEPPQPIE